MDQRGRLFTEFEAQIVGNSSLGTVYKTKHMVDNKTDGVKDISLFKTLVLSWKKREFCPISSIPISSVTTTRGLRKSLKTSLTMEPV